MARTLAPDPAAAKKMAEDAGWVVITATEAQAFGVVVRAAEQVHQRYLRMWQRKANRVEDRLGSALARLRRASGGKR